MFALLGAVATIILFAFYIINLESHEMNSVDLEVKDEMANGHSWNDALYNHAKYFINEYGFPFGQRCISWMYYIYINCTILNVLLFLLKYVPTGIYTYRLIKNFYITSRERIKQKQRELEDIQLQIQIVNTKLCVRDAEFTERAEQVRRGAERLRTLRARVRDVIASDEALTRTLERAAPWGDEPELQGHASPEEEREFIYALLKELKPEPVGMQDKSDKYDCGEHPSSDLPSTDSMYSSLNDFDGKQDCHVKIVKVTNVYKVAYLRHYIKQKRLRRASKQAILKKKIESIKKLLEDWQKSLNRVINTKLSLLDPNGLDVASQDAMGDYSKPNLLESSDSGSDMRTSGTDMFYDEYNLNWTQNNYRRYPSYYEEMPEKRDFHDRPDFETVNSFTRSHACDTCDKENVLSVLPEETTSQMAIEEIKSEQDFEAECRDLITL